MLGWSGIPGTENIIMHNPDVTSWYLRYPQYVGPAVYQYLHLDQKDRVPDRHTCKNWQEQQAGYRNERKDTIL